MKPTLLLTGAAVALTLGLTPALAQDHTDSKLKREPAATERHHDRNFDRHVRETTQDHRDRKAAADASRKRETTGQVNHESTDKTKAPDAKAADSNTKPDSAKAVEKSGQPQRAESKPQKPSNNAANTSNSSAPASKNAAQNNTQSPDAQKSTRSNEPNRNAGTNAPDRSAAQTNSAAPKAQVSASLDPKKKTELHTAIARIDAKPVTHVNFSVSVGTVVPHTVELRPLPTTIVSIVPQYRGYDYMVVRDEVVIVEPRTHKIVDVIERGPSRARAETTTTHRPRLSAHQREIIRRHASSKRHITTGSSTRTTTEITVGQKLPDTVEIESFPDEVYREVPSVREYRYIERGDDVYLVDPSTREVIEEVR